MSATLDVKLTVRESDGGNWWVVERAEHDGRIWFEGSGPNTLALITSARINSADVEGTAAEMLALSDAIERHDDYVARRCACHWSDEGVDLWSPRNSYIATLVRHDRAAGLVETIRREVTP